MWNFSTAAATLTAVLLAAGCGGDDGSSSSVAEDRQCPEDTKTLEVRDVVEPASSHEIVAPNERLQEFTKQWEKIIGERLVSSDAAVYGAKAADNGAGVIVLNADEKVLADEISEGAADAEAPSEPIEMAGEEGALVKNPEGAYLAAGAVGDCAAVIVVADTKELVQDAVKRVRRG